jgi:NCS1 family nucleobase:cation symporter-1
MGFYQRHLVVKGAEEVKDKNTTLANVQINVMLHAIFPRTSRLPNVIGPGSSLDSGGMISFALFYVISEVAMLGWTVGKAGGLGPCCPPRIYNTWLGLRFLMLEAANCATFACNAALFPKFIAGKRGFVVCAAISFAVHPWYLLGTASIFVSFLVSY